MIVFCSAWKRLNTGQNLVASSVVSETAFEMTSVSTACRSLRNSSSALVSAALWSTGAAGVVATAGFAAGGFAVDSAPTTGNTINKPSNSPAPDFNMVILPDGSVNDTSHQRSTAAESAALP